MGLREVLARNLRKLRGDQRISQEELAHRADVNRTYVSALECCRYGATIDVIERMANALGVEAAELLKRPPAPANRRRKAKPKAA